MMESAHSSVVAMHMFHSKTHTGSRIHWCVYSTIKYDMWEIKVSLTQVATLAN